MAPDTQKIEHSSQAEAGLSDSQIERHPLLLAAKNLDSLQETIETIKWLIASEQGHMKEATIEFLTELCTTGENLLKEAGEQLEAIGSELYRDRYSSSGTGESWPQSSSPTDSRASKLSARTNHPAAAALPPSIAIVNTSLDRPGKSSTVQQEPVDICDNPPLARISSYPFSGSEDITDLSVISISVPISRGHKPSRPPGSTPRVSSHVPGRYNETWIMNETWRIGSSYPPSCLSAAEFLLQRNNYQGGLIAIDLSLLPPSTTTPSSPTTRPPSHYESHPSRYHASCQIPSSPAGDIERINLQLLRSCVLLACDSPSRGLESADTALALAEARPVFHMVSKSQLYRGLCLMNLRRWREASSAFTRAANVRDWAGKVAQLKNQAEMNLAQEEGIPELAST